METNYSKKILERIANNSGLCWSDVTFHPDGDPKYAGTHKALTGFNSPFNARLWAEVTGGLFVSFIYKPGWCCFFPKENPAKIKSIKEIAHPYKIIYFNNEANAYFKDNEKVEDIYLAVFGKPISKNWIDIIIDALKNKKMDLDYPNGISEEEKEMFKDVYDFTLHTYDILKFGRDIFLVVDDINHKFKGLYYDEYPASYCKDDDDDYEIWYYGVLYEKEKKMVECKIDFMINRRYKK